MISSLNNINGKNPPDIPTAAPPPPGSIAFVNPFSNIPKLSRNIALLIIFLFILVTVFPSAISFLALIPGRTLGPPFLFYNLFTSSFVETTVFSLVLNLVSLLLMGKQLEPLWSSLEFAKFIAVVSLGSGILTYWSIIFLFFFTEDETLLFKSAWFGFTGISSALLVGIKQINPDQEIKIMFVIPLKVKFLPLLIIGFSVLGRILEMPGSVESLPFVIYGIYIGWLYLRFFKRSQGVIGDQNESFGFDSFFPSFLSTPVKIVGNLSYKLIGVTGFWKKFSFESQPSLPVHHGTSSSADAQRRRKRAAEALEKRLAEKAASSASVASLSSSAASESPVSSLPSASESSSQIASSSSLAQTSSEEETVWK